MNKREKLLIKILDTMIELHDYSDVEDVARWLKCGSNECLSVDELRLLKKIVLEGRYPGTHSEEQLKKKLSDQRFMLRFGKAVVRCKYLHEFGINVPFYFFMLPDYIHGKIHQRLKAERRSIMKVNLNAVLTFVLALIGSFGFTALWHKSRECRRLKKERDELLDTAFDSVCMCNEREIMNLDLINDLIGLVESSNTAVSAETIAEMRELTDKQRLKCYRNLRKLAE